MCFTIKSVQSSRVDTCTGSFLHRQTAVSALQASRANETLPCPPGAQQVAKAVNNATERSLVLIDEFGKGTNTVRRETDEEVKRGKWRERRGRGEAGLGKRVWAEEKRQEVDKAWQGQAAPGAPVVTHPHPALCPGGWARTPGCCDPTLAGAWTHVSPYLCGHQLSEPCSATAAAAGASCAVFGKETNPAP